MRVVTNAESVTATQNNPVYRSSLAQHTRNQIDSLSKKAPQADICSTLALSPSALASPLDISLLPCAEPLNLAIAEDARRALANPDYGAIAEKAIRTEPSPLDLSFGVATSDPSPIDSDRAELKTPPTTKTASGSFSDASTHLQSPESPQIWKLDQSHTLASLGLAFGLSMADPSQQQPQYPWESAQRESAPFNQRQSGFGGSSMAPAAPQQGVPSGYYSQNVQIPNYPQQHASSSTSAFATDYPPFSQHAQQAGLNQNYTSIDPARLGTGNDQYYGQNYAFGQQKPSPISPGLSHPQSPLTLHPYHQGGPSQSGPRSAEAGSSLGLLGTNPDRWDGDRPRRRSDDGPYLHARGSTSYQAKRKGTWAGGKTDLAMIKQELDFLAQTEQEVAEMKNDLPSGDRKERRRMQNRLAQRAFRARSKVHHQEVSKHINDLEDLTDNQGGEIDRLEHLVERLQRENMLLRKAVDWSALGLGEDTPGMEQKRDSPA